MSPTAPLSAATENTESDGTARYRLGNAALILLGLAGLTLLVYLVVNPSQPLLGVCLIGIGSPLFGRATLTVVRSFRRKQPSSDAAIIADHTYAQDERQAYLSYKASALAGSFALAWPLLGGLIGTGILSVINVTIDTSDEWTAIGICIAYGSMLTYTIVQLVAARYYSRRG